MEKDFVPILEKSHIPYLPCADCEYQPRCVCEPCNARCKSFRMFKFWTHEDSAVERFFNRITAENRSGSAKQVIAEQPFTMYVRANDYKGRMTGKMLSKLELELPTMSKTHLLKVTSWDALQFGSPTPLIQGILVFKPRYTKSGVRSHRYTDFYIRNVRVIRADKYPLQ